MNEYYVDCKALDVDNEDFKVHAYLKVDGYIEPKDNDKIYLNGKKVFIADRGHDCFLLDLGAVSSTPLPYKIVELVKEASDEESAHNVLIAYSIGLLGEQHAFDINKFCTKKFNNPFHINKKIKNLVIKKGE